MAKTHKIKNDNIEFVVFASARVFTLFEKKYEKSIFNYIQEKPHDMEAYAEALYYGYKSACKLVEKEEKYTTDDFLDLLDMNELIGGVASMLGINVDSSLDDKKK